MSAHATIGHNSPPDPIDEAVGPFGDAIELAEGMLCGDPVKNADQMRAVDAVLKDIKALKSALTKAEKEATAPLHQAWKDEKARWKPSLDDADRMAKGLAASVDAFKRAEKARLDEEARQARITAQKAADEAKAALAQADATDIDAARAAQEKADAAKQARHEASVAGAEADSVKGLRKVPVFAVDDYRAALNDIAVNDPDALRAFITEYARQNHQKRKIDGVRSWVERKAF